jgi:mono/diheme cytochrome c family protein
MSDESKKKINERYQRELQKGERFWPDSIFKDAIMALAIFLVLILLAAFIGIPSDLKADPSDTAYIPRPEWYFLFLFKFLALYGQIPLIGKIEWIAAVIVPGIAIGLLVVLPFIDKRPERHYSKRAFPISVMCILVVSMITLTLMADVPIPSSLTLIDILIGALQISAGLVVPAIGYILLVLIAFVFKPSIKAMISTAGITTVLMVALSVSALTLYQMLYKAPASTEPAVASTLPEQIQAGEDIFAINCVECHGDDGTAVKIEGVKGLEGKAIPAINSKDVLYTLNDAALAQVVAYGRPQAGMPPFGKAYNPAGLSQSEIDYLVTYIRYNWDDRFEKPVLKPLYPPLAANEIPSYDVHIAPILQRYCVSCHRAGKENNSYWLDSYDHVLKTGDDAPNVVAGDPNSPMLVVIQGTPIPNPDDPAKNLVNKMPPNKALSPEIISVLRRWVIGGMPQTAADAAAPLPPAPLPTATPKP